MTSQHRRRANQKNARASTGPRSRAGKALAAANARRHGLATPIWRDEVLSREVERLAQRILGMVATTPSPPLVEQASRVAEAQLELVRIRKVRRAMLEPMLTNASYFPRKSKDYPRITTIMSRRERRRLEILRTSPTVEKLTLIISDSAPELKRIERYERRTLSRRNRAMQDFDTLRILEEVSTNAKSAADQTISMRAAHEPLLLVPLS